MSSQSESGANREVPLFPLGQPLYPGIPLNLRIFEQRYLRLVGDSVRDNAPFGIVPILRGSEVGAAPEFHPWGTLVTIRDWEHQADGLLGITVQGDQRLQVLDHRVGPLGLILAHIRPAEEFWGDPPGEDQQDLLDLLEQLEARLDRGRWPARAPTTTAELGWRLATLLPLARDLRLRLLAEADPDRRLALVRRGLAQLTTGD